jgi:hypothetical protein
MQSGSSQYFDLTDYAVNQDLPRFAGIPVVFSGHASVLCANVGIRNRERPYRRLFSLPIITGQSDF